MFFGFHHSLNSRPPYRSSAAGTGMLLNGIICVLFGLAILAAPELLAYLVASFLIVIGSSILLMWWKLHRWMK